MKKTIEKACELLPYGWTILLVIEKDSAWVEIQSPAGTSIELDSADKSIQEQILSAIEVAKLMEEL